MKTAEEILKKHTGHAHGLMSASTIEAMKEYAKEVSREALKNAANNACIIEYIDGENPSYTIGGSYSCSGDETPITVEIHKQSILNDKNIPEI